MAGFAEIVPLLDTFDRNITLAINALHCPASDFIWSTLSASKFWIPLYLVLIFLVFRNLGWKKALILIAAVGLTVLFCDQSSHFVKYQVCRLRPCHDEFMLSQGLRLLEGAGSKFGFFSAHACNFIGVSVVVRNALAADIPSAPDSMKFRRIAGNVFVCWAVLVGISRIFVGKHYFGDVAVGLVVGLAIGILVSLAYKKLTKSIK